MGRDPGIMNIDRVGPSKAHAADLKSSSSFLTTAGYYDKLFQRRGRLVVEAFHD